MRRINLKDSLHERFTQNEANVEKKKNGNGGGAMVKLRSKFERKVIHMLVSFRTGPRKSVGNVEEPVVL